MKTPHQPLVIGNWKMNPQTVDMAVRLTKEIKKKITRLVGVDIVVAPPSVYLGQVKSILNGKGQCVLGAQNTHAEQLGAHTGEVSLPMLKSLGVTYVILGHSERRKAGETDAEVHAKIQSTIKAGLTAVVCVGEEKRDHSGHYLNHVEHQVKSACAGLSKAKLEQLVIAYEPIWAIGTGNTATGDDAHEMKLFIQKTLTELYGRNFAQKVRIIYGGSVNEKNAKELMEQGMVDGFLVGGASLHASEFAQIIKSVEGI